MLQEVGTQTDGRMMIALLLPRAVSLSVGNRASQVRISIVLICLGFVFVSCQLLFVIVLLLCEKDTRIFDANQRWVSKDIDVDTMIFVLPSERV
jgi:uncharacterized membrane protein YqaE (UPF0057 family)